MPSCVQAACRDQLQLYSKGCGEKREWNQAITIRMFHSSRLQEVRRLVLQPALMKNFLLFKVDRFLRDLIKGGHNFRVGLETALRHDQRRKFFRDIDVG